MLWWLSSFGAVIAAIATFVVSWAALKPRQRLFAKRLVSRWMERSSVAFVFFYFCWVNVSFLLKSDPIGRVELCVLLFANAEVLILIFVKMLSVFLDKRNERWEKMAMRIAALEEDVRFRAEPKRSRKTSAVPAS